MKDERHDPCGAFEEAIDGYVDGRLDQDARRQLEQHLEACAACRALAADLRAIRRTAGTLDRRLPPRAVWQRIEAQIDKAAPVASTRRAPRWYVPLAAAAVIVLAVGIGVFRKGPVQPPATAPVTTSAHVDPPATTTASAPPAGADELARTVEAEMQMAEAHYEKAISGLEAIARAEEKTLDPQLAATLRKNLGVIDQAISESRAALKTQPDSEPAQTSLFEAFRDKLTLLQDTVALINEMRKGNQTEAARIVGGMNKM